MGEVTIRSTRSKKSIIIRKETDNLEARAKKKFLEDLGNFVEGLRQDGTIEWYKVCFLKQTKPRKKDKSPEYVVRVSFCKNKDRLRAIRLIEIHYGIKGYTLF